MSQSVAATAEGAARTRVGITPAREPSSHSSASARGEAQRPRLSRGSLSFIGLGDEIGAPARSAVKLIRSGPVTARRQVRGAPTASQSFYSYRFNRLILWGRLRVSHTSRVGSRP